MTLRALIAIADGVEEIESVTLIDVLSQIMRKRLL